MAVVDKPWDGSPSRWPDTASYCSCCAIDENDPGIPSDKKVQSKCKLPYKEPNGDINKNALGAAAAALAGARGGVQSSPQNKKKAAKALLSAYNEAQMSPPDSLKKLAGS